MRASDLTLAPGAEWKKSNRSGTQGNCVELAKLANGGVAMRHSKDPDGTVLVYTSEEIRAFILGAGDGDFNHLI